MSRLPPARPASDTSQLTTQMLCVSSLTTNPGCQSDVMYGSPVECHLILSLPMSASQYRHTPVLQLQQLDLQTVEEDSMQLCSGRIGSCTIWSRTHAQTVLSLMSRLRLVQYAVHHMEVENTGHSPTDLRDLSRAHWSSRAATFSGLMA